MSHEFRTPLNAIIGIAEMLEEDVADDAQSTLHEPISRILRASRLLLELIKEILDLAKVEAGKLELHSQQRARARSSWSGCRRLFRWRLRRYKASRGLSIFRRSERMIRYNYQRGRGHQNVANALAKSSRCKGHTLGPPARRRPRHRLSSIFYQSQTSTPLFVASSQSRLLSRPKAFRRGAFGPTSSVPSSTLKPQSRSC